MLKWKSQIFIKVTTFHISHNSSLKSQLFLKVTTFHERRMLVLQMNKLKENSCLWRHHKVGLRFTFMLLCDPLPYFLLKSFEHKKFVNFNFFLSNCFLIFRANCYAVKFLFFLVILSYLFYLYLFMTEILYEFLDL